MTEENKNVKEVKADAEVKKLVQPPGVEDVKDKASEEPKQESDPEAKEIKALAEALQKKTSESEAPKKEEPKKKTEQELAFEKREKGAKKIVLSLYENGEITVAPVQNVKTKADCQFIINLAKDEYLKHDIANMTAFKILEIISKNQKNVKDGKKIYVPGQK